VTGLLPHHAHMLHVESGIDPEIARRRGCRSVTAADCHALGFADYQCGNGLLIPQWTTAGVQVGFQLRRDTPRTDAGGKAIKYEVPAGAPVHLDIHPGSVSALRDPETTLYFTEGSRKVDALRSRGLTGVSLTGVFAFLHGRLVIPDFDDIELDRRPVRAIFDSDVTIKPAVAEALLRLCAALHRRGAQVEVVTLPPGPNDEKTGADDFFARGGTPADLDALARPWTGDGPGIRMVSTHETDDELRRQRDAARDDSRALMLAIVNPDVPRAQLVAIASATAQILAKQQRGEIEPDGTVLLSAAEIADDWRPAPETGERIATTNPNGARPRLARERIKPLLTPAVEQGLIHAKPQTVIRKHANGTHYRDTAWAFDPIPSIAAALSPWATYHPTEPVVRKPRTTAPPCPLCHEVHPIVRRDACAGCGSLISERILTIEPASDKRSEAKITRVMSSSPAPLVNDVRSNIGGDMTSRIEEPAWFGDLPSPDESFGAAWLNGMAPPTRPAQADLAAADRAMTRDDLHTATDRLTADLAPLARERGRSPVPKPTNTAGDDAWTF